MEIDHIQKERPYKVHLARQLNRFDKDDILIADFDLLWVITFKKGKCAAHSRPSFAAA